MEITPIIKTNMLKLPEEITVSEMIGRLKKSETNTGLVFRNEKYVGLVDKKKLLRTKLDTSNIKLGSLVQNTPLLDDHADIIESAYLMFESNLETIPVARNKEIIGVLNGLDLSSLAADLPELANLKVQDLKIAKALTLNKDDSLAKAIDLLKQQRADHLAVLDKGKLYGVLSYTDLLKKFLGSTPQREVSTKFGKLSTSRGAKPDTTNIDLLPVSNFSTNDNLKIVNSTDNLTTALRTMTQGKVSCLPVIDKGKFLGLLTVKNLLRLIGSLKIKENFNIKFIGLKDLGLQKYDVEALKKITANEAFKIQRVVKNNFNLSVHLKEYQKDGSRHKYAVNLRVEYPGKIITASQDDWDWRTAVRKTFANAKNEVNKMFKY